MVQRLLAEASRRRVFRGAATYIFIAWLALKALALATDPSDPVRRLALWWAAGLFPLAIVFSWVFQLRPGVVRRERNRGVSPPATTVSRTLDALAIAGVAIVAVVEGIGLIRMG
jgi:hypothetical protein